MDAMGSEFICSECGSPISRSDTTCPNCGAPLEWADAPAQPEAPRQPDDDIQGVSPMTLGDIFDRTFRLIGKTFTRSILIVLILFVPATVLLVLGCTEFYGTIGELTTKARDGTAPGQDAVIGMLRSMVFFGFSVLVAYAAAMAGELAVTILVRHEFSGASLSWKEAWKKAMGIRYLRGLGVMALEASVMGGIFLGAIVLSVVLRGGFGPIFLFVSASIGFVVFLLVRWSLAFTIVGCEDRGIIPSLQRSWALVKDQWWRMCGILLLLGLLVGFGVALLTTPVSAIAMWDFYREYFRALGTAGSGQPDPELLGKAMSSIGPGVGISISLNLLLETLIKPVYTTILYFDLRVRKKLLEPPTSSLLFPPAQPESRGLPEQDEGSYDI